MILRLTPYKYCVVLYAASHRMCFSFVYSHVSVYRFQSEEVVHARLTDKFKAKASQNRC